MHFADSIIRKLHIYLLVFCFVVSLLGMAVVKLSRGGRDASEPAVTAGQKLRALENLAPQSPAMSRFLQNEKATQQANREVCGGGR